MIKRHLFYGTMIALSLSATSLSAGGAGKNSSYEKSIKQQEKQRAEAEKQLKKSAKEKDKLEKQIRDASEELSELTRRYQNEGYRNKNTRKKIEKAGEKIKRLSGELTSVYSKYQHYSNIVSQSGDLTRSGWVYEGSAGTYDSEQQRQARLQSAEASKQAVEALRKVHSSRQEWMRHDSEVASMIAIDGSFSFFNFKDPALEQMLPLMLRDGNQLAICNRRQAYKDGALELDVYIGTDHLKDLKNVVLKTKYGEVKPIKWEITPIPSNDFNYLWGIAMFFDTKTTKFVRDTEPYEIVYEFANGTLEKNITDFISPLYDQSWNRDEEMEVEHLPQYDTKITIQRYDEGPKSTNAKGTPSGKTSGNSSTPTDPMKF